MSHRAGCLYRFVAVLMDRDIIPDGTIVRVVPASGLPSRFAYIEHVDGRFIQMVCSNSLSPLTPLERRVTSKMIRKQKLAGVVQFDVRSFRTENINEVILQRYI